MQSTTLIGMDISKYSFEIWGLDARGKHTLHKRIHRDQVSLFFSNFPPCTIAMEACGGAQHWARQLTRLGHQVRLIPAQHVIPFRRGPKNDRNDAEAIAEAAARPRMRTAPVKTVEQQDIQAIHRVRERLVHNRTALICEIRGLLMEYGIVRPKGCAAFRRWLRTDLLTSIESLSPMAQETFKALRDEFQALEARIEAIERRITELFKNDPTCQRLATVPGVGPLTATALLGSVPDPQRFQNGRQFAAYLGLVPRQHSTGGRAKLLGITKGGDCYLRTLLVHGARSVILHAGKRQDRRSRWVKQLVERRGLPKANVALANKNARVLWRILTSPDAKFVEDLAA